MAVYFIQAADKSGPIKIGYAKNPKKRLSEIQRMSPIKLVILKVIDGDRKKEAVIHRHFSALRLYGEWFIADREIFDFIDNPYEVHDPYLSVVSKQSQLQSQRNLRIVLSNYLNRLHDAEWSKPASERKPVPSIMDLAQSLDVREAQMIKIASNSVSRLDLSTFRGIITQLRRYGHNTQLTDILEYIEE